MARGKNPMQGNTRRGSESILASCCISTSVNAKAMQRNALFSVVLWTGLKMHVGLTDLISLPVAIDSDNKTVVEKRV